LNGEEKKDRDGTEVQTNGVGYRSVLVQGKRGESLGFAWRRTCSEILNPG